MTKEVADAFGLHPDSLEMVEHDDQLTRPGHCQSCTEWARKCAAIEAELAECKDELERSKKQVAALLMSSSLNCQ